MNTATFPENPDGPIIYTIGHSTHPWAEFLEMLQSFQIQVLVDVRRLPGSRKFPQFDQQNMAPALAEAGIEYLHFTALGGKRKPDKDSKNTRWRNRSFRAYADYMETPAFEQGMEELEALARQKTTAYMCSEAVWWRCHRSMISDYLKAKGWQVFHIMAKGKAQPHRYTAPAVVENGSVSYAADTAHPDNTNLFSNNAP